MGSNPQAAIRKFNLELRNSGEDSTPQAAIKTTNHTNHTKGFKPQTINQSTKYTKDTKGIKPKSNVRCPGIPIRNSQFEIRNL